MTLDIISYGEASRADRMLKNTQKKLGEDMLKHSDEIQMFNNLKERVDNVTEKVTSRYRLTDELAKQNAMNILKAQVQLSLIENLQRVQGDSLIFDDLIDLSGVDVLASSGYTHSSATDNIRISDANGEIILIDETVDATRRMLIYNFGGTANMQVYVSRKTVSSNKEWVKLPSSEGVYQFKEADINEGKIRFMIKGPVGTTLNYYGWVIA